MPPLTGKGCTMSHTGVPSAARGGDPEGASFRAGSRLQMLVAHVSDTGGLDDDPETGERAQQLRERFGGPPEAHLSSKYGE